ncbi:MAG: hypothetical protein K0R57_4169 [Paenibacillaceae bacterium]|jgi:hypothetical protein|nr:hypothetical protein [Paenibacillaceae bacterium]
MLSVAERRLPKNVNDYMTDRVTYRWSEQRSYPVSRNVRC